MKPIVKKKWVAALTSGKYNQTSNILKEVVGGKSHHCCLGVLCELYIKDVEPSIRWKVAGYVRAFKGNEDLPPQEVLEWAGLSKEDMHELAAMNDEGSTFAEIADKINETKTVRWSNQYGRGVKKISI